MSSLLNLKSIYFEIPSLFKQIFRVEFTAFVATAILYFLCKFLKIFKID